MDMDMGIMPFMDMGICIENPFMGMDMDIGPIPGKGIDMDMDMDMGMGIVNIMGWG